MHSSRMPTARSLTVSHSICWWVCVPCHACPPTMHTPSPATHNPCHACPCHAYPLPCTAPHHACLPLPCMPPHATHTRACMLPAMRAPCHVCPLPCTPPMYRQTRVKTWPSQTSFAGGKNCSLWANACFYPFSCEDPSQLSICFTVRPPRPQETKMT